MSNFLKISRHKLGMKIFLGWLATLFIPMVLFALVLFIQYGDNIKNVISGEHDFWQRNGYTFLEKVNREINNWTLDDPIYQDHDDLNQTLDLLIEDKSSLVIAERKNEEVNLFLDLTSEEITEVTEAFEKLESRVLPKFAETEMTQNEELLSKTGYVLYRHIDFYYADGSEGSVFLLIKYTNVPYTIMKAFGDNLMIVIAIMMIVNAIMSFIMINKMTKPVSNLLTVMKSYQKKNFSPRLELTKKKRMLYTINSAVNDMAGELEESQEKDMQMEKQRVEFFTRISHDTKTPLASIRAHTEALRDGVITDDQKRMKYTSNILSKVESLNNMINELNLYSELETGLNQYYFSEVALNQYMQDILEELQYDYDKEKVLIRYHDHTTSEQLIYIDPLKFHRIFMNLIGNSVRYNQDKSVHIDVSLSYKNGYAVLEVLDDGVGISIDKPSDLLDSFKRGDDSRNPNKSGSGLGLAIVRSIVERHEGSIELETVANSYFKVIIKLPLEGDYFEKNINN
jgi:histidine kinase